MAKVDYNWPFCWFSLIRYSRVQRLTEIPLKSGFEPPTYFIYLFCGALLVSLISLQLSTIRRTAEHRSPLKRWLRIRYFNSSIVPSDSVRPGKSYHCFEGYWWNQRYKGLVSLWGCWSSFNLLTKKIKFKIWIVLGIPHSFNCFIVPSVALLSRVYPWRSVSPQYK